MILTDEDALICDLAETYGIFDFWKLPADLVATLAVGLRDDSRIKLKLEKMEMPLKDYLLAAIFDNLNWLCWTHTKDADNGVNQPERILHILMHKNEEKPEPDYLIFDSAESFENKWKELLGDIENG